MLQSDLMCRRREFGEISFGITRFSIGNPSFAKYKLQFFRLRRTILTAYMLVRLPKFSKKIQTAYILVRI